MSVPCARPLSLSSAPPVPARRSLAVVLRATQMLCVPLHRRANATPPPRGYLLAPCSCRRDHYRGYFYLYASPPPVLPPPRARRRCCDPGAPRWCRGARRSPRSSPPRSSSAVRPGAFYTSGPKSLVHAALRWPASLQFMHTCQAQVKCEWNWSRPTRAQFLHTSRPFLLPGALSCCCCTAECCAAL